MTAGIISALVIVRLLYAEAGRLHAHESPHFSGLILA